MTFGRPFSTTVSLTIILAILPAIFLSRLHARDFPIDQKLALQYFSEIRSISESDAAGLWGEAIYGPMMFVDRATRTVVANQADAEGTLTRKGEVFTGILPAHVNIANMAVEWSGVHWTMVVWPLPSDLHNRASLMAHECFHRIQEKLEFPLSNPPNNHLALTEGRIWLRLELRAFRKAVSESGESQRKAIEDGLIFRKYRQSLFPLAAEEERALELNEGIANYTGVRLSGRTDEEIRMHLTQRINQYEHEKSYSRSFAYETGPIYGYLLDQRHEGWRKNPLLHTGLDALMQSSIGFTSPANLEAEALKRARRYDGSEVIAEENKREQDHRKLMDGYKTALVDGPVLVLPLENMNVQFDPDNVHPFKEFGTIYPTIRVVDYWGRLSASKGAMIHPTWTSLTVSAPADPSTLLIEGEGWTLELNEGWIVTPGSRPGDYLVKKIK